MFFEHQISILKWFLNDHVTLKPGVIAAENSAFASQEYIIFYNNIYVKYFNIKINMMMV